MSWGTVDLIEVIWTLAAVPGWASWALNLRSAYRSLRAVRGAGIVDGRRMVARYTVRKSWIMMNLSGVFILIGVISMLRPANPAVPQWDALRVVLTVALLGAPAMISYLGADWRRVETEMLRVGAARDGTR